MADLRLNAIISAKDEASSKLKSFGNSVESIGSSLKRVGVAAIAGFGALTYGLKQCVDAYAESQAVMAQTNAVLASTQGVAGVTASAVTGLAKSLQNVTRFSDETIQSGENILLTFTNIGKDIFPEATETMLNMSQALGQDVKSSAIQLGKALQDPILGVTALRRVGVNFNEESKKTIETMVKEGRIMDAQKFILKELQTEFGNSARAAGETFAGKLDILRNKFDDMKETIGKAVVEAITPFIDKLVKWASTDEAQRKIEDIAKKIGEVITKMVEWIGKIAEFVEKHPTMAKAIATIGLALVGLSVLQIPQAILAIANLVKMLGGMPTLITIGILIDTALIYEAIQAAKGLKSDIEGLSASQDQLRATNERIQAEIDKAMAAGDTKRAERYAKLKADNEQMLRDNQSIIDRYGGAWGWAYATWDAMIGGFGAMFHNAWQRIKDDWDALMTGWKTQNKIYFDQLSLKWEEAKFVAHHLWDGIKEGWHNAWSQVVSVLQGWVNKAIGVINQFLLSYDRVASKLGAPTVGLIGGVGVKYTPLQAGGIIPETGTYLMHKGERVTPEGSFTGGGGITVNAYFYGNINQAGGDLGDIGRQLARSIELARQGIGG